MLSNDLVNIEMVINRLEHDRIDFLGYGDPVLSNEELYSLNHLQAKTISLKMEYEEKAAELLGMKSAYYKEISRRLGCRT